MRDQARVEAAEAIKAEYLALREDWQRVSDEHVAAMRVERELSAKRDSISRRIQAMERTAYLVKEEL